MSNYKFLDSKGEHMHTLDDKPLIGTSTVTQVIAKPLTYWASGLAVAELGWQNAKLVSPEARLESVGVHLLAIKDMDAKQFLALLDKAYSAHSKVLKTSAVKGTDMHAELEKYVKNSINANRGIPMELLGDWIDPVKLFATWARENVAQFLVSEGYCYSEKLWTGGITDCIAVMKNGHIAILDFKSSKEAYDSQFIQVSGYDIEQAENGIFDANGSIIASPFKVGEYIVIPFGAKKFTVDIRTNVDDYKRGFESAVVLHKLLNVK